MRTIVVGVDGSPCSVDALRWAVDEADRDQARAVAVLAWTLPRVSTMHEALNMVDIDFEQDAHAALDATVREALSEREAEIERVVVESPAAAALIAAARGADLLVVGSRGHGGFTGLLLGSVSQQVAAHAPCPVVVVRTPDPRSSETAPIGEATSETR